MIDLLQVFVLAMTPIGELRLSIPMGVAFYHLPVFLVFIVSVIGNFLPALFLLLFFKSVSDFLSKKSKIFQKFFSWWKNRTKNNHSERLKSYGAIGLALFVAIPLPITGAWSGALLATIMNLPLKKSIPTVLAGIIGAGIIVTTLVILGVNIEAYLGWKTLVGVLVFIAIIAMVYKTFKKNTDQK